MSLDFTQTPMEDLILTFGYPSLKTNKKEEPKKGFNEDLKSIGSELSRRLYLQPIQSFSWLENGHRCLDGITEKKRMCVEKKLLFYQRRFKASHDSDEITFTDYDTFTLKNITSDYFCFLQGGEERSHIDLMENILRLRNQLMEHEDEYVSKLEGKCSKNKKDIDYVLEKIVLTKRELEDAEKVYLISRWRSWRYLNPKWTMMNHTYSEKDLLKRMISWKKKMMKLQGEYVESLKAGATIYDDDVLSQYSEDVLQRAVSSKRELLGLEELDYIEDIVSELYNQSIERLKEKISSLWERQEMYPNLAYDLDIDYKINRLQLIVSLRQEYLEVEDHYLWLLRDRHTKNHDNASTSFDVRQIHSYYALQYVGNIVLRWMDDLTMLQDIYVRKLDTCKAASMSGKRTMEELEFEQLLYNLILVNTDSFRMDLKELEYRLSSGVKHKSAAKFLPPQSLQETKAGEASHEEECLVIPFPMDDITMTVQPSTRDRKWEIRRSIVLGGLIQSITSLVIITAATSANISDGNVVILALTNLITGLFIIRHNLSGISKTSRINKGCSRIKVEAARHYKEVMKEQMYYVLNFIIAFLSFLFFGFVAPLVYALSSFKIRNKNLKIIAAAGASLLCTAFLAIQKARIQKPTNWLVYVKTAAIYVAVGVGAFGMSYFAGYMFGHLVE